MKKLIILLLCPIFILCLAGCEKKETVSRNEVVINMPEDNSVNGYRVSAPADTSSESKVTSSSQNKTEPTKTKYCANINSKVFHKISCSSVSTMKEQNKAFFLNRELLINDGYTPCKRCNP